MSDPAADCTRAAANLLADAIKEGVTDDPAELRPILDKLVEAVAHRVVEAFIDAKRKRRL